MFNDKLFSHTNQKIKSLYWKKRKKENNLNFVFIDTETTECILLCATFLDNIFLSFLDNFYSHFQLYRK